MPVSFSRAVLLGLLATGAAASGGCTNEVSLGGGEGGEGGDAGSSGCVGACTSLVCGDGVVGDGEECDDGNADSGDGCTADCRFDSFFLAQEIGEPNTAFYHRPGVGAAGRGEAERFVVAWPEQQYAWSGAKRIMMRSYDPTGASLAEPVLLSGSAMDAACASVAGNAQGLAVVTWVESTTASGGPWELRYAVIRPDGVPGPATPAPIYPQMTFLGCPKVAAASNGDFCIVAQQKPDELTPPTVQPFCIDAGGAPKQVPPPLSETHAGGSGRQWGQHAITGYGDGFILLYFDAMQIEDSFGQLVYPIIAARVDADGNTNGALLTASTGAGDYIGGAFAPPGDGPFVLGFGSIEQNVERFMLQRWDSYSSQDLAVETPASSVAQNEFGGAFVGNASGELVAAWSEFPAGGQPCNLYYRALSANLAPRGDAVALETDPAAECGEGVAMAAASNGNVMFVWNRKSADWQAPSLDIQARIVSGLL